MAGTSELPGGPKAANRVFAGPTTGADAQPTFRVLVIADMPAEVLRSQNDPPSSPAAGQLWYEADVSTLWYYDGVQWITVQEFSVPFDIGETTGDETAITIPLPAAAYINILALSKTVGWGAMDKWTLKLEGIEDDGTQTVIDSEVLNTVADLYEQTAIVAGYVSNASYVGVLVTITKAGAPTSLICSGILTYRKVRA